LGSPGYFGGGFIGGEMKGCLVLETGEVFFGDWLGGQERAGEVVFNTSHSGYEEIVTDPSYYRQIMVMTAPMVGNYGVQPESRESHRAWVEGLLCVSMQNTNRDRTFLDYLISQNIPVLEGLDTRALVKLLRDKGTLWGAILRSDPAKSAAESKPWLRSRAEVLIHKVRSQEPDWVYQVSRPKVEKLPGLRKNGVRVVVIDFGCKNNILRILQARSEEVIMVPSRTSAKEILSYRPSFLMLSNGPGDPSEVQVAPETIKILIGQLPIFAICMGHQLLARALGAETYRLKFGHRASNHPVRDQLLNWVYVTAQNHGYAVRHLPNSVEVTHINLNDGSCAGFFSRPLKLLSVQFHPEAAPGPHEARQLFEYFYKQFGVG
jgi:carbamoyl-phosphate synthase small subunit